MMKKNSYQIPSEYFFRLHHVRPRFKNDVEEVLLYVATSIADIGKLPKKEYRSKLNSVLRDFKKNQTATQKTIDNWRTEISALFAFIQNDYHDEFAGKTAERLSKNQYLDEFFNYFLYSFQYPAGHIKSQNVIKQIQAGIHFKPCQFILELLSEGSKLIGKPFSITAEELTQCAYYDLRITRDGKTAREVAKIIITNRENKVIYNHKYEQLKTNKGNYPSKGDVYRYAGDILDYMVLANLLDDKGTGFYYYLNDTNQETINFHINNPCWFENYDKFYKKKHIESKDISVLETDWFNYVNQFDNIDEFLPAVNEKQDVDIYKVIQEYYQKIKGKDSAPTKIFGDYGETLALAHEFLRTQNESNRQHLINKIPTPLGVGFDLQSIEIPLRKRYIEVKTTKSKKAIKSNRFKLTPNEWDSAETLLNNYFIYYIVINNESKWLFVIQNPVEKLKQGTIKVDKNLVVEFSEEAGKWQKLLEIQQ